MDATLKGLVGLLDGADIEARCAALVVLTRMGVDEARVARGAAAAVKSPNVVLRDFALGYFEHVKVADAVAAVLPLLDADDEALRRRAVSILAPHGAAAVSAARRALNDAPRRRLTAIVELCAAVRSSAALDTLFELMTSDDFDTSRAACEALVAQLASLADKPRADLLQRSEALAAGAKGRRTHLVAAAKLFGALAEARARKPLFAMLGEREPPVVRSHALGALSQCLRGKTLTAAEIAALLALLDDDDESGILRPAVRLLEDQTLERSQLARLNQLADSPRPVVKRFAVQKLGGFDSGGVVKTLIGFLTDDSYARRDQAIATLKTLPAARLPLMKALLASDDERKAWTLADIVLLHERGWKRDTLQALWTTLEKALEQREDRLYAALHHVLHGLDADWLALQIRARADKLRKSKHFAESARWLLLLKDTAAWDDEARFAHAVATLKMHKHPLGTAASSRDAALEGLRTLADSPFPLGERLRKERMLEPEDLYYVAFALADGGGERREVAAELLAHLADRHGRTKVGKAAKNKLQLISR
ncbi:MAG: HEAT repeat domain-containing protein [bacterium]